MALTDSMYDLIHLREQQWSQEQWAQELPQLYPDHTVLPRTQPDLINTAAGKVFMPIHLVEILRELKGTGPTIVSDGLPMQWSGQHVKLTEAGILIAAEDIEITQNRRISLRYCDLIKTLLAILTVTIDDVPINFLNVESKLVTGIWTNDGDHIRLSYRLTVKKDRVLLTGLQHLYNTSEPRRHADFNILTPSE